MNQAFLDYFRCPDHFGNFSLAGPVSKDCKYFRFGSDTTCYGQCSPGGRRKLPTDSLYDASQNVTIDGSTVFLPFDPTQVIENLRYERYAANSNNGANKLSGNTATRNAYYLLRPFLPIFLRRHLQRMHLAGWDKIAFPHWPVDTTVEHIFERLLLFSLRAQNAAKMPFIWFWPDGLPSGLMITHDVETPAGKTFCSHLMDVDDSFGIKASFQIVPERRYTVSEGFLNSVRDRGFEVNIQDLNHDGYLFRDRETFLHRVQRINRYAKEYGAIGYRSAVLYRNVEWYGALHFQYDMSLPNVGHLEAQRGGCCTVMPYFIGHILELPVTTTQDYSLFHLLNNYSTELWKRQIGLIMGRHGLASFIIHPDYVMEKRARDTYEALLRYVSQLRSEGKIWVALPKEVNNWWRERSQMRLVEKGGRWCIEGPGSERARVAYAMAAGRGVVYSVRRSG